MHPALRKCPLLYKTPPISTLPHFPLFYKKHPPPISFPAYGSGNVVRYCVNRAGEVYDYEHSQRRLCDVCVRTLYCFVVLAVRQMSGLATTTRRPTTTTTTSPVITDIAQHL